MLEAGTWSFSFSYQYRPLTERIEVDDDTAQGPAFKIYIHSLSAELRAGIGFKSELLVAVPVQNKRLARTMGNAPDETLTGFGDTRFGLRHALLNTENLRLSAAAGVMLPTGKRNDISRVTFLSSAERRLLGLESGSFPILQAGNGSTGFFVAGDVNLSVTESSSLTGFLEIRLAPWENDDGYTYGNRVDASASYMFPVHSSGSLRAGLHIFKNFSDSFEGEDIVTDDAVISGTIPDLGNSRLDIAARLSYLHSVRKNQSFIAQLSIPVFNSLEANERPMENLLREPAAVLFGYSFTF